MDYIKAYKKLKQKFPDKQCCSCIEYKGQYIFSLFPTSEEEIKKVNESLKNESAYDDSWSVDKQSGEIKKFGLFGDLLRLGMIMEAIKSGTAKNIHFNERDILES